MLKHQRTTTTTTLYQIDKERLMPTEIGVFANSFKAAEYVSKTFGYKDDPEDAVYVIFENGKLNYFVCTGGSFGWAEAEPPEGR